jgi:hypothetical protein
MKHLVTRRQALWAALLGLVAISPGCNRGPQTVTVTGKILRGGQPLAVGPTGYVQVMLLPDVGADEQYTTRVGRCEKDGTFVIPEVQPGKYKIGVEQLDPNPQLDKLNGAFRAGDSKIIRDVDGKTPIEIDLAKPEPGR